MNDRSDTMTRDKLLQQIRTLLAAIQREAGNKGVAELVDLAQKADNWAVRLQHLENE